MNRHFSCFKTRAGSLSAAGAQSRITGSESYWGGGTGLGPSQSIASVPASHKAVKMKEFARIVLQTGLFKNLLTPGDHLSRACTERGLRPLSSAAIIRPQTIVYLALGSYAGGIAIAATSRF